MLQITLMKEASFWKILILGTKHIVAFSVIKIQSVGQLFIPKRLTNLVNCFCNQTFL